MEKNKKTFLCSNQMPMCNLFKNNYKYMYEPKNRKKANQTCKVKWASAEDKK